MCSHWCSGFKLAVSVLHGCQINRFLIASAHRGRVCGVGRTSAVTLPNIALYLIVRLPACR